MSAGPSGLPNRPRDLADAASSVWRPVPTGYRADGARVSAQRVVVRVPLPPVAAEAFVRRVCGRGARPRFDAERGVWLIARAHFRKMIDALAERFGDVAVCVDVTVLRACGDWCVNAIGDECDCSCLGENHGGGEWSKDWTSVDEHWAVDHRVMRRWFRSGEPRRAPVAHVPAQRVSAPAAGSVGREPGPAPQRRSQRPIPIYRSALSGLRCPQCAAWRLRDCADPEMCAEVLDRRPQRTMPGLEL